MDFVSLRPWIEHNQPLINFGLLIGAVVYTVVTGWILRINVRQMRVTVQPALTLKRERRSDGSREPPYLTSGSLVFCNTGNGTGLNVSSTIYVHSGSGLAWMPKFSRDRMRSAVAVQQDEDFVVANLEKVFSVEQNSYGEDLYKQLHEYEVFLRYASIVGTRYLTYVSAGMAGEIRADYVGTDSLMQRLLIWIGVAWRYYAVHIPIWRKLRRQKKQKQHT